MRAVWTVARRELRAMFDGPADINDAYGLGAQSFIRKPVDHGRFAHAVRQTTQYWLGLNESLSDEPSRQMNVPR